MVVQSIQRKIKQDKSILMGFTLFEKKTNGNNRILSKLVVDQSENALQYRLPTTPTAWLFLFYHSE